MFVRCTWWTLKLSSPSLGAFARDDLLEQQPLREKLTFPPSPPSIEMHPSPLFPVSSLPEKFPTWKRTTLPCFPLSIVGTRSTCSCAVEGPGLNWCLDWASSLFQVLSWASFGTCFHLPWAGGWESVEASRPFSVSEQQWKGAEGRNVTLRTQLESLGRFWGGNLGRNNLKKCLTLQNKKKYSRRWFLMEARHSEAEYLRQNLFCASLEAIF